MEYFSVMREGEESKRRRGYRSEESGKWSRRKKFSSSSLRVHTSAWQEGSESLLTTEISVVRERERRRAREKRRNFILVAILAREKRRERGTVKEGREKEKRGRVEERERERGSGVVREGEVISPSCERKRGEALLTTETISVARICKER